MPVARPQNTRGKPGKDLEIHRKYHGLREALRGATPPHAAGSGDNRRCSGPSRTTCPKTERVADIHCRRESDSKQRQLAALADRALEQVRAQLRVALVEA